MSWSAFLGAFIGGVLAQCVMAAVAVYISYRKRQKFNVEFAQMMERSHANLQALFAQQRGEQDEQQPVKH